MTAAGESAWHSRIPWTPVARTCANIHALARTDASSIPVTGTFTMTAGVAALPGDRLSRLVDAVRSFADLNADNDPHAEHDFGAVESEGARYFWKIDYYDRELKYGSENPADPEQTARVLTIMRAEEY